MFDRVITWFRGTFEWLTQDIIQPIFDWAKSIITTWWGLVVTALTCIYTSLTFTKTVIASAFAHFTGSGISNGSVIPNAPGTGGGILYLLQVANTIIPLEELFAFVVTGITIQLTMMLICFMLKAVKALIS